MIFEDKSFRNLFFGFRGESLQQSRQLKKQAGIQLPRRQVERVVKRRIGSVSPFSGDAETAACRLAKNQRFDAAYTSRLEYLEALTAQRMKGMKNLRPSQMLAVVQCSSR